MNYLKGEELINQVLLELRSYSENGKLVEPILYAELERLNNSLGLKILPIHSTALIIENGSADLPSDFNRLLSAWRCSELEFEYKPDAWQSYEKEVCDIPICKTRCDYCWNNNNDLFQVYMREIKYRWRVRDVSMVSVSNHSSKCDECINPKSNKGDIYIENGKIYSRFNMKLFIEYRANFSEGEILIPDYPQITKYFKEYLKYTALKDIFINYDVDNTILKRIELIQVELPSLEMVATTFSRQNNLSDFYDLRNILRKSFNQYKDAYNSSWYK